MVKTITVAGQTHELRTRLGLQGWSGPSEYQSFCSCGFVSDSSRSYTEVVRAWEEAHGPRTAVDVWAVLVEECGADPDGGSAFSALWPCSEYRFQGALGFGGKVRWKPIYGPVGIALDGYAKVDCYPEDLTPERKAMIDRANARLNPQNVR